jgi:hypothetical protein
MASTITFTWLAAGLLLASGRLDRVVTPHSPDRATSSLQHEGGGALTQNDLTSQEHEKRSGMWWRRDDALIIFEIDERRSKELEAIFQRTLPMLKATRADVVRKEAVLLELLANASTTNESAVIQAVEDLESSRRSLARAFTMMQYHMYLRLTSSQRAKVHAYLNSHDEEPARPRSRRSPP